MVTTPAPPGSDEAVTLALDVADVALSMGVPASDAVTLALDVLEAYTTRRYHVDVLSTMLMLSSGPVIGTPPVTVLRSVGRRPLDNTMLAGVQALVGDIRARRVPLAEARDRMNYLTTRRTPARFGMRTLSSGIVSAAVPMLYGGSWLIIGLTLVVGCLADLVIVWCAHRRMPAFFLQMVTAAVVTAASALLAEGTGRLLGRSLDPTLLVVGGIVMLVVGLMFVGAFQDAIDEYYLTAAARAFRVAMMTAGIVPGILMGAQIAAWAGVEMRVVTAVFPLGPLWLTTLGAALIAAAYDWYCRSRPTAIVAAGVVGAVVWLLFLALYRAGWSEITASAAAAGLSGLMGALVARRWKVPGIAVTTAGIVTLVPGLRLFSGLMGVVAEPGVKGWLILLEALGIAFSIAAGASAGAIVGRPLRQRLVLARNQTRQVRRRLLSGSTRATRH